LVLGAAYGLALLGIAMWPNHVDESLGLSIHRGYATLEFVANIVLFVPFGALALLSWRQMDWRWAVLGGVLVSSSVELVQATLLPGRTGSLQDVVANTLGAAIGGGLVLGLRRAEGRTSFGG
jgi:glycopeptide antibiotics resistance protein